jgi:nucleotide-binding universal stress UspA family protein
MNAQVSPRGLHRSDTAVVVPSTVSGRRGACVLAAIDDDSNAGTIIRYARAQAIRLGVPLRVVHVWNGGDRPTDADQLLSTVLYHHLPADEASAAERQIVHDREPARALRALSSDAALIVLAATSNPADGEDIFGDTVRQLVGDTRCPLAVLPPAIDR